MKTSAELNKRYQSSTMLGRVVFVLLASVAWAQNDTSWQRYIYGPQSLDVYPVSVVSSTGNVVNPTGLLPGGTGDAVLSRNDGEEAPSITLDFGLNTVGFLSIDFNGASTNSPGIRLAFSETLQYLSDLSDYSRSNMPGTPTPITPGSDQIAVQSTPYTWTAAFGCANGNQVCSDGLHGFRYLKIYLDALDSDAPLTSKTGSVNIASVSLKFSAFLATPDTFLGHFECSDDELNQYWYGAVYTNDLTTDFFRDTDCDPRNSNNGGLNGLLVLYDGAKRDRDPYVGDVAVSGRTTYLSHFNLSSAAARNVLADLGDHQREDGWIPPASVMDYTLNLFDYPLWWVIAIWDYALYTGDTTLVEEYFPNIVRVFEDYYLSNTNQSSSLIVKPGGMGDYAFVGRDGEAAYYNALYVLGLQSGAECASYVGNISIAVDWTDRANTVSASFNEAFWDEAVGAYKNFRGDTTSHPQDGNSLAILAGIANDNQANSALQYLNDVTARPYGNAFMDDDSLVGGGSQRVYAFMSNFEIRARFERFEEEAAASALDEIKRLYGWMHTHDPTVTYWEGVGTDGSMYQAGFTSAAHGWSTGVVGLLTNYVVGLVPLTPGGAVYGFYPSPTALEWAQGTVPTVNGLVTGKWSNTNETYTMEIDAPPASKGRIVIPVDGLKYTVSHNGEEVWRTGMPLKEYTKASKEGFVVLEGIVGGEHVIEAVRQ